MAVSLELQVGAANNAAAANNVVFAAVQGLTFYLTGFDISGLGATGASLIQITLTGMKGANTPTWTISIPAGVTTPISPNPLTIRFGEKGFPAAAQNSSVTVNVPSFGAGNTDAHIVATGYYA